MTGTFDDWSKSEKLVKTGDSFSKNVTLPSAAEKIYYKVRGGAVPSGRQDYDEPTKVSREEYLLWQPKWYLRKVECLLAKAACIPGFLQVFHLRNVRLTLQQIPTYDAVWPVLLQFTWER